MAQTPFSLRIFVADGDPDGLRIVDKSNWIGNGVLVADNGRYQFTQDYTFSAPSTAADVVLGRSANGRVEWKALDKRTLKVLQEAEASQ